MRKGNGPAGAGDTPGPGPQPQLAEVATVDTRSISPAGDGFYAAAKHRSDHDDTVETHYAALERPHECPLCFSWLRDHHSRRGRPRAPRGRALPAVFGQAIGLYDRAGILEGTPALTLS